MRLGALEFGVNVGAALDRPQGGGLLALTSASISALGAAASEVRTRGVIRETIFSGSSIIYVVALAESEADLSH